MTLVARRVVARFRLAATRTFYARREARPDLYADLQKQFKQFQSSLFALAQVGDLFPDGKDKDKALDMVDDLPTLLDATIGLPHEKVLELEYHDGLKSVARGLADLEKMLAEGVPGIPPKKQRAALTLIKSKVKAAQAALDYITRFMDKYAKEMKSQEAKDRQKAEKDRQKAEKEQQKAEKDRQKAEKAEAKDKANQDWCQDNCAPCKDNTGDDYYMEPF